MNRAWVISCAGVVCLAALSAAIIQGWQVSSLRAEQQRLLAQVAGPGPEAPGSPTVPEGQASGVVATAPPSAERLRLRGEVTRLEARQRELALVRAENERLRLELAAATNNAAGAALPPGYLRRADARMAGCGTPEDTLETLLWALQHEDEDRLAKLFSPIALQGFRSVQGGDHLIGMAIVGKEQMPVLQQVVLRVLVAPEVPPTRFFLQPVGGEWKITGFFP